MKRIAAILMMTLLIGCGGGETKQDEDFFTSGNPDADQRAEQRMAKAEQMNPDEQSSQKPSEEKTAEDAKKLTLYERLGGEKGISAIVDDFVARVLADPRVNWARKGVKEGGLSLDRWKSVEWSASPENVNKLKKHLAQFLAVATGGPAKYEGREMKSVHAGMHITNAQFDASVGDLKTTLDKLQVPNAEQKELLAVIETTRPQVAEKR